MMLLMKFDYNWPAGNRDINVWKCGRTDGRTDALTDARTPARVQYYKLTLSLRLWWAKKCQEYDLGWEQKPIKILELFFCEKYRCLPPFDVKSMSH